MKVPQVGVGIVVIREEKILMGKRKNGVGEGLWAFPGGHLEWGESIEACAMRELEEETGLKARSCQLGGWASTVFYPDKHYITLFSYILEFEGEPQLMEPEKCEGWQWFDWASPPEPYFPTIEPILARGELEKFVKSQSLNRPLG